MLGEAHSILGDTRPFRYFPAKVPLRTKPNGSGLGPEQALYESVLQTHITIATYQCSARSQVPSYNSLKACKGTMFFLPLPLDKTVQTIDDVMNSRGTPSVGLPDPELYIVVSGNPSKQKVLWQSLVNVAHVTAAIKKLKQINWLYANIDNSSAGDACQRIIESISDTTSTMLVKATAEDVKSFQAYTIRRLDQKQSNLSDTEHYKLMNIKEDALSYKLEHLDVLFPTLFPSGRFGESHDRSTPMSLSEYAKPRLLNKDSRFCKDSQYVFYLLWYGSPTLFLTLSCAEYESLEISRYLLIVTPLVNFV